MSMFNDIDWTRRGNSEHCISHSEQVRSYAKRCSQGHWTFLRPGSELKWCGTQRYHPEGKWEAAANQMVKRFQEAGHPVLKSICLVARGILRRKNNRDTIHFTVDASNAHLLYRTIHSANHLSFHGAVASWCEEFVLKADGTLERLTKTEK